MFTYEFMRNAFVAILLITPLFAIIGTMIVNNKMAFFSDALGHSALTGIAIGMLLGIDNPIISMIGFALIFAYIINTISNSKRFSNDTIISVFSSTAIALGLVMLSKNGDFSKYSNYLIGDILSVSQSELIFLFIILILTIIFWFFCFNKLLAISINTSLAKSKAININLIQNIFVMLIAVIVMVCIKWVGILIINSLLILPVAASKNIANNMRQYHLFAICFSVIAGLLGLIISYYMKTATGPTIVIISSIIFFITFFLQRRRG